MDTAAAQSRLVVVVRGLAAKKQANNGVSPMLGLVFRLVFGVLGVLFGTSIIFWVLYNHLVQRQPGFNGPRFFSGFGAALPMLTTGIYWLRNLRRKPDGKSEADA